MLFCLRVSFRLHAPSGPAAISEFARWLVAGGPRKGPDRLLHQIDNLIQYREGDRRSRGAIFDMEFAEDVFDMLADRARGRANNDADIVIAFAF